MSEPNSDLVNIGLGIVSEDKHEGSTLISVTVPQLFPRKTGEVSHEFDSIQRSGKDIHGTPYTANIVRGDSVIATWHKEPNRITSPSVKKGEQVQVYRIGDTDRYFWASLGRDSALRRTEEKTISFTASSTKEGEIDYRHEVNQYQVSVDTDNGHITVKTSMSNGEKAAYTVQIDGRGGKLIVEDHKGNGFNIDSEANSVVLKVKGTKDNQGKEPGAPSFISIEDGKITLNAKDIIILGNMTAKDTVTANKVAAPTVEAQHATADNLMYKP